MRYEAPESLDAAVALLAGEAGLARILAGGTDLLVQLRSGRVEPDLVVDVKRIPELCAIAAEDGGFRVGAAVTGAELGEHAEAAHREAGAEAAGTANGLIAVGAMADITAAAARDAGLGRVSAVADVDSPAQELRGWPQPGRGGVLKASRPPRTAPLDPGAPASSISIPAKL